LKRFVQHRLSGHRSGGIESDRAPLDRFNVPRCDSTENGDPDCQIMMPLTAQPPSQRFFVQSGIS